MGIVGYEWCSSGGYRESEDGNARAMLRIITDFDGPIMDVSPRYYRVYQYCLREIADPGQPLHVLSRDEFWCLKRSRVPEREIGKKSGLRDDQAQAFARLRSCTVHTMPYLVYDRPVPGAIATLEKLQRLRQSLGLDLAVMTMRHTCELEAALDQHQLRRFFPPDRRYCLSDDYSKVSDVHDKPRLMESALADLPTAATTWMIGDTEADMVAAQSAGVPAIAVLSGIRDRHQLSQYQPDYIVADFQDAIALILEDLAQPDVYSA